MRADESEAPDLPDDERERELSRWERFFSGLVGMIMVGAGGTAVFFRDVEAGPAALIAIGAVLVVMATTGAPIRRAKFGDNEVTMARRRERAIIEIESASPEEAPAALRVMAAYDPLAAHGLSGTSAVNYEQSVTIALMTLYPTSDLNRSNIDWGADISLRIGDNYISIIILFAGPGDRVVPLSLLRTRARPLFHIEHSRGLIITSGYVHPDHREAVVAEAAESSTRLLLEITHWRVGDDLAAIGRAVTSLTSA